MTKELHSNDSSFDAVTFASKQYQSNEFVSNIRAMLLSERWLEEGTRYKLYKPHNIEKS